MDAQPYCIMTSAGVWIVDESGERSGPYTDMAAVLEALGPPTPQTEALADMAFALLVP